MFCMLKVKVCPAYASKHNSSYEKQVILLMILNWEKCYCLVLQQLSALLKGITFKHQVISIAWITFIFFARKKNLNPIKNSMKMKISVL